VSLVISGAVVLLKPVEEQLEEREVLVVEVKALGSHLDELLQDFLFGHISQDDVLGVLGQNSATVWDLRRLLFLFLFKTFFKLFKALRVAELGVLVDFTNKTVARNDVPLNDFSYIFEVVVRDDQAVAD